ncbi:hypothetical protein V5799_009108 [Amblyomma americanum]|uniref:Uncharacterized protein n=1 Tax=Amblyomma americanum TaxID=6943 RepID=A0AAQ4FB82_AMBAM
MNEVMIVFTVKQKPRKSKGVQFPEPSPRTDARRRTGGAASQLSPVLLKGRHQGRVGAGRPGTLMSCGVLSSSSRFSTPTGSRFFWTWRRGSSA